MKNDKWFLDICNVVAQNSKCLSRKIGSIIVRDDRIISTGYNGPPKGVMHCNKRYDYDRNLIKALPEDHKIDYNVCPRYALGYKSGEGLEWCTAGHAERNSIVNAARLGVCTKGTKMYMSCPTPCSPCLIEIINAGIEEIIVTKISYYDKMAEWLIRNSGLEMRTYRI